ncbi:MAG: efflux RND transporter periplasmic adaptor subunit [Bdellovibrio sp.]
MKIDKSFTPKIIYGSLLVLLAIAVFVLIRPKKISVETASVIRGTFVRSLRVDGTMKTKNKVTVLARASGDLGAVDLEVGDIIKKNQVITILRWDFADAVKSPMTGIVSKVYRVSAGPISRGEPIIDIIDPDNTEIESEVLTNDAVGIPMGSIVKISGSGMNETLKGHIIRISRAGFKKISALGIEEEKTLVYTAIDSPQKSLGDIFHVDLDITLSEDPHVLIVPLGALFKNKNQWAVYTIRKNKATLRNIELSKKNDTQALITGGLQEGEAVILFPGDQISEGTPVKVIQKNP